MLSIPLVAQAEETKEYPDLEGVWTRGSPVDAWDPYFPKPGASVPPLTPEYEALWRANIAKRAAGTDFDMAATCGPIRMPRLMALYEPFEIVIKPKVTYLLLESMSPIRRIYTDGRDWPQVAPPAFAGYSIGKWVDSTNSGTYDTLEVETRNMRGPALMDSSGIPLHADNQTVVKERLYLEKNDPDILRDEITTFDNAFARPWTLAMFYRRERQATFKEFNCTENPKWVTIGGELYLQDQDSYLMPVRKDQSPPDLKYLQKYWPANR